MNYREFQSDLRQGGRHNCYLFAGPEAYLVEDSLEKLLKELVDPATRDFNFDQFYANEVDAARIVETANAYPMMAENRVVVVKNFRKLAASGLDLIHKYLDCPSETTRLVLITEKLDFRSKVLSGIKNKSCFVEFKHLYDNKVPAWITEHAKERGLTITRDACHLVHAYVGTNLRGIVNEIDKIALNLSERTRIEEDDVRKVVGISKKYSIFNLNDAIGERRLSQALKILNKMLENGESPTGILALITRQFVNFRKLRGGKRARIGPQQLQALTGIPRYFIEKTSAMAERFNDQELDTIFELLLETDLALKTSRLRPPIALQSLLIKIIKTG